MVTDNEVLARLLALVRGATTLDAFEDWFLEGVALQDTGLVNRVAGVLAETAECDQRVTINGLLTVLVDMLRPRVVSTGATADVESVDTTGWFASSAPSISTDANITEPVDRYPVPA